MIRTHKCNELKITDDAKEVKLVGWVQRMRDHGGKKFIDLRDREGITQVVFDPDVTKNFSEVESYRREFLIEIQGLVRPRPEGTVNKKLETGEVEVIVKEFSLINACEVLPFDLDKESTQDVNEELRLEYRYLDLRRPEMLKGFQRRHKFISALRYFFDNQDFIDVNTPTLTKSTPEGARDMLVPSRKHEGKFYALPQSPQLFKQLLMVAGFEKYYQIATCYRDEDSRKDRQLEFQQLDLEMSFMDWPEFKQLMEESLIEAMKVYDKSTTHDDFVSLTYAESMEKYGSDKPDMRIQGLELVNISEIAENCGFSVFKSIVERKGLVKGLRVPNGQEKYSRKQIDKLIEFCQVHGAKGMAWMKVIEENKIESSIAKFFSEEELESIREKLSGSPGDLLFFIADTKATTNDVLDALRRRLAVELDLISKENKFAWITNFPLFQIDEENGNRLKAEHSPFTMPNAPAAKFIEENIKTKEDIETHKAELLKLNGDCYDLSFNGIEICSGALRIHKPDLQKKVFEIISMPEEQIEEQFGWFLKAYNYGAPMHRGLAFGIDRIVMLLEGKTSIRDVIAFPKTKNWTCPLTHSPSPVDNTQLKELHVKLDVSEKKKVE
jgi:aspartyl-tRNA synthetase